MEDSFLYKDETFNIIGAAYKVHQELGSGFLETVYQEALGIMFDELNIPYEREKELPVTFRGKILEKTFRADFVCYDKIIVELKAVSSLCPEHEAQVINYLKASGIKVGLLINFAEQSLRHKRLVRLK